MENIINLALFPIKWIYKNIELIYTIKIYKKYIRGLLEITQSTSDNYICYFATEMKTEQRVYTHKYPKNDEITVLQAMYLLSEKYQLTQDKKKIILNILKAVTPNIIYDIYNEFMRGSQFFFYVEDKSGKIIHKEIISRYIPMINKEQIQKFLIELHSKKFNNIIKENLQG